MLAWWLLAVALAEDPLPRDVARAIAESPWRKTWDRDVARRVHRRWAPDRAIDDPDELRAIPCAVWHAVDAQLRRRWGGHGLDAIYGLNPAYLWLGDRFGVDEALREDWRRRVADCGIALAPTLPG